MAKKAAKAKEESIAVYPDIPEMGAEPVAEDPILEEKPIEDVKDQISVAEYEEKINKTLENQNKEYFVDDYKLRDLRNKRRAEKAEKYGKFMLEYGSTYDPEWDGDFNNYGLPEEHPFTKGVKLSRSRRRSDRKERFTGINEKKIDALSRAQCSTDLEMIKSRINYEALGLELDVAKYRQDFSGEFRSKKEKRWFRDSKNKLKDLKHRLSIAERYEKLDNDRYYTVVATDFDTVELPATADRAELIAMREELMRLLDVRDEINMELIDLYIGADLKGRRNKTRKAKRNIGNKGRMKAVLAGRKRAYASLKKHYLVLSKRSVARNDKIRIFDKMDEIVELYGEISRIRHILKKEKPTGKLKRQYRRDIKNARNDIKILKSTIDRATVKALRRAKKRELRSRGMTFAYILLILLALATIAMVSMGNEILEAFKLIVPEDYHNYIDTFIEQWPF